MRLRAELGDAVITPGFCASNWNAWGGWRAFDRADEISQKLDAVTLFRSHQKARRFRIRRDRAPDDRTAPQGRKSKAREVPETELDAPAPRESERRLCSDAGFGAQACAGTRSWLDAARLRQILPARRMRHLRRLAAGSSTFLRDVSRRPVESLAYAAACRVAEPRAADVPPCTIRSMSMRRSASARRIFCRRWPKRPTKICRVSIYLTAEKFMTSFVSSLSAQTSIAFKENLRAIDMLIIDDVQFLKGPSIQQEFCHTLNALTVAGRQVIVAADRPPSELEDLDERVLSRFKGGLCVEIGHSWTKDCGSRFSRRASPP